MYTKKHTDQLTPYECMHLIGQLAAKKILQTDPRDKNKLLLYKRTRPELKEKSKDEGLHSEPITDLVNELYHSTELQRSLWEFIESVGYEPKFEKEWWLDNE